MIWMDFRTRGLLDFFIENNEKKYRELLEEHV